MTIETPVSPNRCAEFLDARQRGEVKGRVEWQFNGEWRESLGTDGDFFRFPDPDTPRGCYRIVHEPAPVRVPALDAVREGMSVPVGPDGPTFTAGAVVVDNDCGLYVVVKGARRSDETAYRARVDADGMVALRAALRGDPSDEAGGS